MKLKKAYALAPLIAVVVASWAWIVFVPVKRPGVLRELAGCYEAEVDGSSVLARIDRAGVLRIGDKSTAIHVTENKDGYAIVPDRRIHFTTAVSPEIVFDDAGPLLLRVSNDMTRFDIPGHGDGIRFVRAACA